MAIEAPANKHKKSNLKLYIGACIVLAVFFGYDGYLSKYEWSRRQGFYNKHVKDGKADATILFNQRAPVVLLVAVGVLAWRLGVLKKIKVTAEENEVVIDSKERISYQAIAKINKTYFDSKGYFVITYKNGSGGEVDKKLSDRRYDNLKAVLDELVAKIT